MPDSAVTGKDASAATYSVDTFTQAGGDHRQAVVVGDPTAASVAAVRASGELIVGHYDLATTGTLTAADAASSSATGAGGQSVITGTPTANSAVTATVDGETSFAVQVTGTFVATYAIERSLDGGTTWTAVGAFAAGTQFIASTWTTPGMFHGNASSCTHMRVRCTAFTSGSMAVVIRVGAGAGTITVGNPVRLYRDNARTTFALTLTTTAPTTADTLASTTPIRAGVAGTAGTTHAVTAGKVLRLTNILVGVRTTTAALPWVKVALRTNPSGSVVIGSPAILLAVAGGTAATAGNTAHLAMPIEDSLQFSGAEQIGISVSGNVNTNVLDVTLLGYEV